MHRFIVVGYRDKTKEPSPVRTWGNSIVDRKEVESPRSDVLFGEKSWSHARDNQEAGRSEKTQRRKDVQIGFILDSYFPTAIFADYVVVT